MILKWYVLLVGGYLCFFFFKQKTAYEMRIRDWSSDVALPISCWTPEQVRGDGAGECLLFAVISESPDEAIRLEITLALADFGDAAGEFLEIAGLAEILVDAGEADVGDRIEALEPFHHQFADALRGDFAVAERQIGRAHV